MAHAVAEMVVSSAAAGAADVAAGAAAVMAQGTAAQAAYESPPE